MSEKDATIKGKQPVKTIDLTPTWQGIMPGLLGVIEGGKLEGRKLAKQELMDLAKKVDEMNVKNRRLVRAVAALVQSYKDGTCYETKNPYVRPEVKQGLQVLADIMDIKDYFDVDCQKILEEVKE